MYEEFYKLTVDPFMMSPDHRFSFPHKSYAKARAHLEYGLLRGEGLVIITGVPGTGKSTVINDLLEEYADQRNIHVARLLTTQLELDALLRMVAYTFGIQAEGMDRATVLYNIQRFLHRQFEAGKHVLLIIDEAQHLSEQALEELRLLTNIQLDPDHRFQIFLLGQPQLRNLIRGPAMEQLRQRIVASCHFDPLDEQETAEYILHRLEVAGWNGDPEITDEALALLHRYSGGIPRRINLLCSRLLLAGAVDEKHVLDAEDVEEVVSELPAEMLESSLHPTPDPGDVSELTRRRKQGPTYARGTSRYQRWHNAMRQGAARTTAAVAPVLEESVEPEESSPRPENRAEPASAHELPVLQKTPRPERVSEKSALPTPVEREEPTISEPPVLEDAVAEPRRAVFDIMETETPPEVVEVEPDEPQSEGRLRSVLSAILAFTLVFAVTYGALWWLETQGRSLLPGQPPATEDAASGEAASDDASPAAADDAAQ
jgi:putative secretion ATPase (PEP-CTERM system associated)